MRTWRNGRRNGLKRYEYNPAYRQNTTNGRFLETLIESVRDNLSSYDWQGSLLTKRLVTISGDKRGTGHQLALRTKLGPDTDTEWATKLIWALDEFRSLNRNITANQIVTFLHIAAKEGITQKDLERATGLDNGTISRICAILSERGLKKRGAEALDLIRIGPVPMDYRTRMQTLSGAGERLVKRLKTILRSRD